MLKIWTKITGFKILSFFLLNPSKKIYINELARELNVSSSSVMTYCKNYYLENVLKKENFANSIFYSLNNKNIFTKQLKKSFVVGLIINSKEFNVFINDNPNLISCILYGSYADGSYSVNSDIDILIIYNNSELNLNNLLKLETIFKKEINITKISLNEWVKKRNKKDHFVTSILKNNICLWGEDINES
jgi:predicted nucleotidyltransferase